MNIYANYDAKVMSAGTHTNLGGVATASTVHQVFCLSNGSVQLTPLKGDTFTFTATAGQYIDVLITQAVVASGTFVGFRAKHQVHQMGGPYN